MPALRHDTAAMTKNGFALALGTASVVGAMFATRDMTMAEIIYPDSQPLLIGCPSPLRPMRVGDLMYLDGGQIVRVVDAITEDHQP